MTCDDGERKRGHRDVTDQVPITGTACYTNRNSITTTLAEFFE